jgi:hypothetical protein
MIIAVMIIVAILVIITVIIGNNSFPASAGCLYCGGRL